jgi:hypothetical protein
LTCFHIFFWAPVQQILDGKFSTVVSHRILTARTSSLPENFSHTQTDELPYQFQSVDDKIYHFYPDAVPLLNVPIVAAYQLAGISPVGPDGQFLRQNEQRILRFAAALQAALLCGLFFYLARIFLRPGTALGLAALFAFGTQVFSTLSRPYWSHTWGSLLLTAALCLLLAPKLHTRKATYFASATLLSWAFFCRPQIALSIIGITVYLIATKRRHLTPFIATGTTWALIFSFYSLDTFHQLLPPYFFSSQIESGLIGISALASSYPSALLGTLVSPGRGLFVYAPIVGITLVLATLYWKRIPQKKLAVTSVGIISFHWLLLSANRKWWGGQSYGPRLFSDVLVWFFLLTILLLIGLRSTKRKGWTPGRRSAVVFTTLFVAASLFINYRGATSKKSFQWRGYSFWDWRHPQFLAGLLPEGGEKNLEEKIEAARLSRDAKHHDDLLRSILESEPINLLTLQNGQIKAVGLSPDGWTHGDQPAGLIVHNPNEESTRPRVRLAVNAPPKDYPVRVFVNDGETVETIVFTHKDLRKVELRPLPPLSTRLFIIWSDKAWSPGGKDPRMLGVRLLAPKQAERNTVVQR